MPRTFTVLWNEESGFCRVTLSHRVGGEVVNIDGELAGLENVPYLIGRVCSKAAELDAESEGLEGVHV